MKNSETKEAIENAIANFESFITQQYISDGHSTGALTLLRHKISLLHLELLQISDSATLKSYSNSSPNNINIQIDINSKPNCPTD